MRDGYRLLDAEGGTTLDSLERATRALGAELVVKILARGHAVAAKKAKRSRVARAQRKAAG